MKRHYCGTVAESVISETNLVFVRYYAEKAGIESKFESVFTAMRSVDGPADACDPEVSKYIFMSLLLFLSCIFGNFWSAFLVLLLLAIKRSRRTTKADLKCPE